MYRSCTLRTSPCGSCDIYCAGFVAFCMFAFIAFFTWWWSFYFYHTLQSHPFSFWICSIVGLQVHFPFSFPLSRLCGFLVYRRIFPSHFPYPGCVDSCMCVKYCVSAFLVRFFPFSSHGGLYMNCWNPNSFGFLPSVHALSAFWPLLLSPSPQCRALVRACCCQYLCDA